MSHRMFAVLFIGKILNISIEKCVFYFGNCVRIIKHDTGCRILWVQIVRNFFNFVKHHTVNHPSSEQIFKCTLYGLLGAINTDLTNVSIAMKPYFVFLLEWIHKDLNEYWLFTNGKSELYYVLNVFVQLGIIFKCDPEDEMSEKWMKQLLKMKFKWKQIFTRSRKTKEDRDAVESMGRLCRPKGHFDFEEAFAQMIEDITGWYGTGKLAREISVYTLELMYVRNRHNNANAICFWERCKNRKINTTLYKCSKCRVAKYCSKKCQKKDWNKGMHGSVCTLYVSPSNTYD
eukprot:892742_1